MAGTVGLNPRSRLPFSAAQGHQCFFNHAHDLRMAQRLPLHQSRCHSANCSPVVRMRDKLVGTEAFEPSR